MRPLSVRWHGWADAPPCDWQWLGVMEPSTSRDPSECELFTPLRCHFTTTVTPFGARTHVSQIYRTPVSAALRHGFPAFTLRLSRRRGVQYYIRQCDQSDISRLFLFEIQSARPRAHISGHALTPQPTGQRGPELAQHRGSHCALWANNVHGPLARSTTTSSLT